MEILLSEQHIDLTILEKVINPLSRLVPDPKAMEKVRSCRLYLDQKSASGTQAYYGINTGFGSLYNTSIPEADLGKLQENLMRSHACGVGRPLPEPLVRLMIFLKLKGLIQGYSGVSEATVQLLCDLFNHQIYPVVPEQGSLGASGDLAPLAHLCLPLLGEGEVSVQGEVMPAHLALKRFSLKPLKLSSKEGLALLNGTQFMSAHFSLAALQSDRIEKLADLCAMLSLEAFDGRIEPFHSRIQEIRPHAGQIRTALRFREALRDSEMSKRVKKHVQDPYSFRCIPQVHGASKDAISFTIQTLFTEINSVTDNPMIFPNEDLIISAGNFHGQPLALAMDFLAIALAELGNISERRTYQLISGSRELPAFLVPKPGLNSGLMIPQYTAASLVSQNKQLCSPASVDSIVSSNGQEDHVSMGANAATRLLRLVENCYQILAIEWLTAAQAMEFRRPMRSSPLIEKLLTEYRNEVSFIEEDRILYYDIQKTRRFLEECPLDRLFNL